MPDSNASDWKSLYPFESNYIQFDQHKMHYVDHGEGEPVVMVHGNPTWSFYWRNLIQALSANHRCIAVDHMGCGLSDKPKKYKYRLTKHTENLSNLLTDLQLENATLVVHDWGGPIGLGAFLHRIHRFKRVVILNTGAFPPHAVPTKLKIARSPVLGQFAIQGMNMFLTDAFKTATTKHEIWTDAMKAGYLAPYNNWSNRKAVYQFVRDIPTNANHPTWNVLSAIERGLDRMADYPVKMIWGMKDWVFDHVCLEKMSELIPHASVHKIESAGHYVMEDAKDEVIEQIQDFIATQ